jgi:hypothetical protein
MLVVEEVYSLLGSGISYCDAVRIVDSRLTVSSGWCPDAGYDYIHSSLFADGRF